MTILLLQETLVDASRESGLTTLAYGLLGGCMTLLSFCLAALWYNHTTMTQIKTVLVGMDEAPDTGVLADVRNLRKNYHALSDDVTALKLTKADKPGNWNGGGG